MMLCCVDAQFHASCMVSLTDVDVDIAEVAVIGVPHKDYGQIVTAIVVPKVHLICIVGLPRVVTNLCGVTRQNHGKTIELAPLQAWARERMSSHAIPRQLLVMDAIPRNAMGKVNKKDLVQLYLTKTKDQPAK